MISVEKWLELLDNREIFREKDLEIVARLHAEGGSATCKDLSDKYGENENFYQCVHLNKRICEYLNTSDISVIKESKKVKNKTLYTLVDELNKALETYDLSNVRLYTVRIIFIDCAHSKIQEYVSYIDDSVIGIFVDKLINTKKIGFGDFIILSDGMGTKLLQVTQVTLKNEKEILFHFIVVKMFSNNNSEHISLPFGRFISGRGGYQKKVFKIITAQSGITYDNLMQLKTQLYATDFNNNNDNIRKEKMAIENKDTYSKEDFLREVYISSNQLDEMINILNIKKNIILQGPPGVGKTFSAKRLAYVMMGEKDEDRIGFIQFHQNYAYEDFIMGYKPTDNGFSLQNGAFYEFCQKAKADLQHDYFFIIDEINRGNLSKIFGELLMLIENEYRDVDIKIAYSKETFSVPSNVYIIGMMNTADRSLAMLDYALRRRFSFYDMKPGFDSTGFRIYLNKQNSELLNNLIQIVQELNNDIENDDVLGSGFCIGHSYFCRSTILSKMDITTIIKYDILPTLKEYWFDNQDKYRSWEKKLLGVLNDNR